MRKFIISDIHGNGDIYDSVMGYLDNISKTEDVALYINGDLIDRGLDSLRLLMDVKERIEGKGNVKIHFLGGNHELMLFQALRKRKKGKPVSKYCNWLRNGGWVINNQFNQMHKRERDLICEEIKDFLGDLKIYHVFDEKIKDKPMLLVHAQAPSRILKTCPMKIKDNTFDVSSAVWARQEEWDLFSGIRSLAGIPKIGLDGYFTIIGHTPVHGKLGFEFNLIENYINIDGGCAGYAMEFFQFSHVPVLEIQDNGFQILVFNHNNEIEKGFYFDGYYTPMKEKELEQERSFLDTRYRDQQKIYQKAIRECKTQK